MAIYRSALRGGGVRGVWRGCSVRRRQGPLPGCLFFFFPLCFWLSLGILPFFKKKVCVCVGGVGAGRTRW
uniref:Uncharacterized protein n=1 Tax=Trypanosoma congolense (strain IL3000) TaxID=1068625 RepID=G0UMI8_TRYCI|nr:hypothetical protein, unlikely [Trypanosoma congolense IL3000]